MQKKPHPRAHARAHTHTHTHTSRRAVNDLVKLQDFVTFWNHESTKTVINTPTFVVNLVSSNDPGVKRES
jgi:hypothetical protein